MVEVGFLANLPPPRSLTSGTRPARGPAAPLRVIHVQHYIIQIDTQCEYVITVIPKSCHVLSDQRCYSSSLEKVCICTERIEKSKPFLKALIFEGLLLLKMPITC